MKQEFVPYQLALELKQLGFDEPCLSYYEGESFSYHLASIKGDDYIIPAPLFQQAFRWFRDNHKHNGIVEGCKKYGFEWCIYPDIEYYVKPPNNFNTYEEAELACLNKLVEIVKSQHQREMKQEEPSNDMCECKVPQPQIKVSENGTYAYCTKCIRTINVNEK